MQRDQLIEILDDFQNKKLSLDETLQHLANFPFQKTESALFDTGRELRRGIPEAIFCKGKSTEQSVDIFVSQARLQGEKGFVLATHATEEVFQIIQQSLADVRFFAKAGILFYGAAKPKMRNSRLCIVSAGTADSRVAAEASVTADLLGNHVESFADLGVAALGRILSHLEQLQKATCIIVIAGMDGALPSVVSGLTRAPVFGVPTSTGYGTAMQGLAALLAMLNSCSPGLSVLNIDNAYGAACCATLMHQTMQRSFAN